MSYVHNWSDGTPRPPGRVQHWFSYFFVTSFKKKCYIWADGNLFLMLLNIVLRREIYPWSIDQGRQKRQYFRFSTRPSKEKLTIFVNLYDNTDLHTAYLPGGRPYTEPPIQIPWPGVLSSPTERSWIYESQTGSSLLWFRSCRSSKHPSRLVIPY